MKIESAAAYRYIKTYAATVNTSFTADTAVKTDAAKKDQLHISGEAAGRGEIGRLTQSIAAELSTGVSSARLQELQQQVANNEYYVPASALADSILGALA